MPPGLHTFPLLERRKCCQKTMVTRCFTIDAFMDFKWIFKNSRYLISWLAAEPF